jgi:hypothetical protein
MKLPIEEDGFWHGVLVDPHPHVMHRKLVPTSYAPPSTLSARGAVGRWAWWYHNSIWKPRPNRDCFLLLGCDGVWENWSHQVRFVVFRFRFRFRFPRVC